MKRKNIIELCTSIIVFVFLYTAISKLKEFGAFEASMKKQVLPDWSKPLLIWLVPLGEIAVSICLLYETVMPTLKNKLGLSDRFTSVATSARVRIVGLYGALVLMLMFTVYVGLAVFKTLHHMPCSCGGIIQQLSWKGHFTLNITLLLLNVIAIILSRRSGASAPVLTEPISKAATA